jgi:hypothetical protein
MKRDPLQTTLVVGWALLAVSLPLGLTLEALHAMKVPVYLGSELRRELWTLAHAHANLLALLCLAFAAVGERSVPDAQRRGAIARWLWFGAIAMPLGFFLGGVLNSEGDPSLFELLGPAGGVALLVALVRAALSAR